MNLQRNLGDTEMTMWKASRDPSSYPYAFKEAIMKLGETIGAVKKTEAEARLEQKRFSGFRFCLKAHPGHPCYVGFDRHHTRTSVRQGVNGLWLMVITTSEKLTNPGVFYEKP